MVFFFVAAAMGLGGVIYFEQDSRQVREEKMADLESIAQLKVGQISSWLNERVGDGWALTLSPIFADAVQQILKDKGNRQLREKIITRLAAFNRYMDYSNILLIDPGNRVVLSALPEKIDLGVTTRRFLARTRAQKQVIFSDFYFCQECQTVHLDIFAPIINGDAARTVKAVLILRIDAYRYLYPALQSWPVSSATGETYLIQKQGDYAVFLNEPRFKKDAALKLKFHLTKDDIIATRAIAAGRGMVEGRDYPGDHSLAAVKKVPGSDWLLVAKMSQSEIFSMIYRHAWYTSIITGFLILATAFLISIFWYRQQKDYYQKNYLLEHEKQLLNQRYQFLTKHANDVILLTDTDLYILDANEKAVSLYGYDRDEILRLNVRDLRTPPALKKLDRDLQKIRDESGCLYETIHQGKDRSPFPVEISCRLLEIDDKQYFQAIIRDISERKTMEQALRRSEMLYRELAEQAADGIFILDADGLFVFVNSACAEMLGYGPDELLGVDILDTYLPAERAEGKSRMKKILSGAKITFERAMLRKDGSQFDAEVSAAKLPDGRLQAIIRDITERKETQRKLLESNEKLEAANQELAAAEEELKQQLEQLQASRDELLASQQKYRSTFENTGTATVIIEPDTTISLVNLEFEKLSGYSRNELEGRMKWTEFVWKPDLERMREYHNQRRHDPNAAPRRYEFRFIDRIGKIKDIFLTIDMIPGTGKSVASLLDITKKNAAEQQVKASLREKEVLLREIYHRVKNNLQVVSSLLSLQSGFVKDPRDKEILLESQNRIRSMSLVHENLYRSQDLSRVDFNYYVRNLVGDLIRAYGIGNDRLAVMIDINDITLGVDTAIPCGLMINEMVTNSLKHAFQGPPAADKKWEITIRLKLEKDLFYRLEVADNGPGFAGKADPLSDPATLGLQLINTLAEQLDGQVTVEHDNGTRYVVEFKKVT